MLKGPVVLLLRASNSGDVSRSGRAFRGLIPLSNEAVRSVMSWLTYRQILEEVSRRQDCHWSVRGFSRGHSRAAFFKEIDVDLQVIEVSS